MSKKKNKKKNVRKSEAGSIKQQVKQIDASVTGKHSAGDTGLEEERSWWGVCLTALLVFLIATPTIVGPYGQKDGYSPDLHMASYIQVGSLIVLFFFMLSTFFRRQISVYHSPLLWPVLLFYAWAMLSVLWANTKYEAVVEALDWSGAFFSALLVIVILCSIRQIRTLLLFLLISGVLIGLLGVGQYLFGIDWVHQHIVPAATFANKNMAGQYGVLIFPIAVAFFLHAKNTASVWLTALAIGLITTYIFYTHARGAWLGFLFELMVLFAFLAYFKIKHHYSFFVDVPVKKIALATSMVLFLGMSYLTPTMLGNQEKVLTASIGAKPSSLQQETGFNFLVGSLYGAQQSGDRRLTIWANSVGMFRDHFLIGVGLGNWSVQYAKYQSLYEQDVEYLDNKVHANAHNDYVEILCELGIIGFALFLWIMFALFKVVRTLLVSGGRETFLFVACLTAALAGISLNAVFSFPFKQPIPIFIILVYMAVLSNLYGILSGERLSGENKAHVLPLRFLPIKAVVTAIVFAAAVGMFVFSVNLYKSEIAQRHAVVDLEKGRFKEAYQAASYAYELNPLRHMLLWMKATAMMQLKRTEDAKEIISIFEHVEHYYPYSANVIVNLVSIYSRIGRYDKAVTALERLLSVQSAEDNLQYNYALLLFNIGKDKEAIEQLKEEVLPGRREHYGELENHVRKLQEAFYGAENVLLGSEANLKTTRNRMEFAEALVRYISVSVKDKQTAKKASSAAPQRK